MRKKVEEKVLKTDRDTIGNVINVKITISLLADTREYVPMSF